MTPGRHSRWRLLFCIRTAGFERSVNKEERMKSGDSLHTSSMVSSILRMGALCVLLAAATAAGGQTSPSGPKYGGCLRAADEIDAMGFDAIQAKTLAGIGGMAGNLVMERLFEMDGEGRPIPVLGLSATVSADGKTWIVKLRQGVSFHDGTPFNADAVVNHWRRILNPENHYSGLILVRPVTSVEKTGDYEVCFHLAHPWLTFTATLASARGFAALIPSPKAVAGGIQNRAPVGTGPFVFKEWRSGDRIVLTRNPHYWQKGKPYLDEVVLRAIPDHETRYAAAAAGEVDLVITDRPSHVKALSGDPGFATVRSKPDGVWILALNTSRPPLDDVRVRRAIAPAWDQKKFIKVCYKGIMKYAENWYGDDLNCINTGYPRRDVEKAKSLVREYAKPVVVTYYHSPSNRGREVGELLQQMLKPIGIAVRPVPNDWASIIKQMFSKEYDIATWSIWGTDETESYSMAAFHSESPWNVTRYSNANVDGLLTELRLSTDPKARKAAFCRLARRINQDAPFIYLCAPIHYAFARKNLKNLPEWRYGFPHLDNVWLEH
jgi:ABC-type transport system substrate-binding protein